MPNIIIKTENDLKLFLHKNFMNQIKNFFGKEAEAMKFLSAVMSAVQRNQKLLQCEPMSVVNSFMTMAQMGFMPSDVSGEAYVLPYLKKGKLEAQFQMGYQGLVTLFYGAGVQSIRAEIVREKDQFSYTNGQITHTIDIFKSKAERGKPIGAYVVATVNNKEIVNAMNATDILEYGQQFSKSWNTEFSPWKPQNDPELWMWKKTVLKQLAKLLPKNEKINRAIAEDNKESVLDDRIKEQNDIDKLTMGNFVSQEEVEVGNVIDVEADVQETIHNDCSVCSVPIAEDVNDYAMKKYGKPLCRKCQKQV